MKDTKTETFPVEDLDKYYYLLTEWTTDTDEGKKAVQTLRLGMIDNRPKFIEFEAKTVVEIYDPSDVKEPEYNKFEKFVKEQREKAPLGLKSLRQSSKFAWAWMPSEKAFVTSAFSGMAIALSFAFVILLIATGNLLLTIISIFCVAAVIVSVVCIMQLQGW